jgi:fructose-1,6-bisphosphatase
MKTQKFIIAECVKSNKSANFVWVVYTGKNDRHYCKNAAKALRCAFIMKRETGCHIDNATFKLLKEQSTLIRPSVQTETPAESAQQ